MTESTTRLDAARAHVQVAWTPERERRVRSALDARVARRARARGALAVVASMLVIGVAIALAGRWRAPREVVASHASVAVLAASDVLFRTADGTSARSLVAGTHVDTVLDGPAGVDLRLVEGSARFDVAPQNGRTFRVLARDVVVTVVGTRFSVGLEPAGVRVRVERGRVQVVSPATSALLGAGEELLVAPGPAPTPAVLPAPHASVARPPLGASPDWRDLAQAGQYAAAYRALAAAGRDAVRDEPGDLLLAADVARLGGHPDVALAPLDKMVRRHAGDPRASLAAFTLGRVFLDDLGRPREAAQAFATAQRLAPGGALAQDALAREVEAWSRAGDTPEARRRAEEFLRRYPDGRRSAAVRRLSGLE